MIGETMAATVATVKATVQAVCPSSAPRVFFGVGAAARCSSLIPVSPLKVKNFSADRLAFGAAVWCSRRRIPTPRGRKHQYFQYDLRKWWVQ
jgi:hypothetical protein